MQREQVIRRYSLLGIDSIVVVDSPLYLSQEIVPRILQQPPVLLLRNCPIKVGWDDEGLALCFRGGCFSPQLVPIAPQRL